MYLVASKARLDGRSPRSDSCAAGEGALHFPAFLSTTRAQRAGGVWLWPLIICAEVCMQTRMLWSVSNSVAR